MKQMLYGCALALGVLTTSLATAQDCCYGPQFDPCCYGSFDGFYVGGNLGVFTHTAHRADQDGFLTDNGGWTTNDTSFTAGVQVGYDWQCCNKLFGVVADWNWVDTDRRLRDNPNVVGVDNFWRSEFHWFTTIRARAGLALCDALVYVTLGAAVARFHNEWNTTTTRFTHHHTRWGWTAGAGTELQLWCNWSLGLEVLFLHFDHHERDFTTPGGATFRFGHSDSAWVGRVLLNYRFGDLFCCGGF